MPLYVLGCCGKEIEVIQGIDKNTPICPDCGARMERLPTSPALIAMKGNGGTRSYPRGYKEDYAKDYRRRLQEAKS